MEAPQLDALANDFFSAISKRDLARVGEIYDPAVEVWHNVTQRAQTREENLELLDRFTSSLSELRYEVHARDFFPGGFVQRHTLHGRTQSGDTIAAPVCIVIHAADGRIQRLFEYLDARAVAAAFAG